MKPFLYPTSLNFSNIDQLELLLDDLEEDDEPEGDPTPETGYLTCSRGCGFINPYEFPKDGFICRGCRIWMKKE